MTKESIANLIVLGFIGAFSLLLGGIFVQFQKHPPSTPTPLRSAASATPRPITTLNYFPAPCRAQATHHDHAYEWLCPNGDVYRTPLTF